MTDPTAAWPADLRGVTESVVATLGPNERWNLAALGLRTDEFGAVEDRVTARTWGRTRTRENFQREGEGVVQFVRDPLLFVDAALGIVERESPVAESADAWARVDVERVGSDRAGDTEVVDWALTPRETTVERQRVATIHRGFNAVVEATVWASRLDVEEYDRGELRDRIATLEEVVEASGGPRERRAFERIDQLVDWR